MSWVAVDEDESEWIFENKPDRLIDGRGKDVWSSGDPQYIFIPKGSIKKLINFDMSWDDEPIEL